MATRYDTWLARAQQLGLTVEPDGSGQMVAHRDGEEFGRYDPKYAGCGQGWFY